MLLKFIPIDTADGKTAVRKAQTLSELILAGKSYEKYLQYQGFHDAQQYEVFQGDLLELQITDELMDFKRDGFSNSNLGKNLIKNPKIISVLCRINYDNTACIGCSYDVFYMDRDRQIVNYDGEPEIEPIASGLDPNFPVYLCQKGAKIIANTEINNDDILAHIADYTAYTRTTPIPQHAVMNTYLERS